jgi:hypothetical protein
MRTIGLPGAAYGAADPTPDASDEEVIEPQPASARHGKHQAQQSDCVFQFGVRDHQHAEPESRQEQHEVTSDGNGRGAVADVRCACGRHGDEVLSSIIDSARRRRGAAAAVEDDSGDAR